MTLTLSILFYFYLAYLVVFIVYSFFNFFHLVAYSAPGSKIFLLLILYCAGAGVVITLTFMAFGSIDWSKSIPIGFQPTL